MSIEWLPKQTSKGIELEDVGVRAFCALMRKHELPVPRVLDRKDLKALDEAAHDTDSIGMFDAMTDLAQAVRRFGQVNVWVGKKEKEG